MPPTDLVLALSTEIHDLAQSLLRGERPGHTLQPTAMLGELWVRLANSPELRFETKEQFIAYAAAGIRHILIDHARRRLTKHRGGGWTRVDVNCLAQTTGHSNNHWAEAMSELGEELDLLRASDPRAARVFELRYFGGMTVDQTAAAVEVSERTVRKDWVTASAWLRSRLESRGAAPTPSIEPSIPPLAPGHCPAAAPRPSPQVDGAERT